MKDYKDIITIESGKRSGQPCIRGMRITVYRIFRYKAPMIYQGDVVAAHRLKF